MEISKKIPVGVLGATGMVGQRFVQLLSNHPWFELQVLAGSEKRVGQRYGDSCKWVLREEMPASAAEKVIEPVKPGLDVPLVFSALPAYAAREVEPEFAKAGYVVCSNASAFRYDADVPMLIPEINHTHTALLSVQKKNRGWPGLIVTSPNCTTTGIALPLRPLHDVFGVEKVFVVTMQAVSGAGYPGISFLDIEDNVIPFIKGEEEKVAVETNILLANMRGENRIEPKITVSVQANRVNVRDGHTVCLSVGFKTKPKLEEIYHVLESFEGIKGLPDLPSVPNKILLVRGEDDRPQPRLDRNSQAGMAVTIGRIRECPILDYRMLTVSHNTLRGAASGSILNAELLVAKGIISDKF